MQDQNEYRVVASDAELQKCLRYLMLSEPELESGKSMKMADIARQFDIERQTLYTWLKKWKDTGIMDQARRVYLEPKAHAIERAIDHAIDKWPEIIAKQVDIALKGGDKQALASAQWLHQMIIEGTMSKYVSKPSSAEQNYLATPKTYDVAEV